MKKVVSNATPIISLASIGKLSFLKDIFGKVYIPKAIYNEIRSGIYPGYDQLNSDFFEIVSINNTSSLNLLLNDLDVGEAECIILAKEIAADILIIDERLGYKIAQSQGIFVIGTLTVLLMAKNKGLIKGVKPLLDQMLKHGRWYSAKIYNHFLKSIGELK